MKTDPLSSRVENSLGDGGGGNLSLFGFETFFSFLSLSLYPRKKRARLTFTRFMHARMYVKIEARNYYYHRSYIERERERDAYRLGKIRYS